MKRSEEILGLSVISIEDGKELGKVSDFIINAQKGSVEYLIVNEGLKYIGVKILPFEQVQGVGEYAVTVQDAKSLITFTDKPEIDSLLEKDVRVSGTKVLTRKGMLIGEVSEFLVDEEAQGKIAGCELSSTDKSVLGIIPSDKIITFGKDILVVSEGIETSLVGDLNKPEVAANQEIKPVEETETVKGTEPLQEAVPNQESASRQRDNSPAAEPSEAAKMFEEKQRKYLIGRKLTKRIESENGEFVAEEGQVITEELLNKAKKAGKFAELSMNTKA